MPMAKNNYYVYWYSKEYLELNVFTISGIKSLGKLMNTSNLTIYYGNYKHIKEIKYTKN